MFIELVLTGSKICVNKTFVIFVKNRFKINELNFPIEICSQKKKEEEEFSRLRKVCVPNKMIIIIILTTLKEPTKRLRVVSKFSVSKLRCHSKHLIVFTKIKEGK